MDIRQDTCSESGDSSPEKTALTYALKVLGVSPKSRQQLKDKILGKGFAEDISEKVIRKLESAGYVNDSQLAEGLVNRMTESRKGFGKRKAAFELKKRGFTERVSAKALEGMTRETELESARILSESVWCKSEKLPLLKRKKKAFDALIRRGFDYETAQRVLAPLERRCRDEEDFNES